MKRLRRFSLVALAALALGCQSGAEPSSSGTGEDLGQAQQAATVCPGPSLIPGVDVADYQHDIDWTKVAASGMKFGIARLNDGSISDTKFQQNWDGIKAAGMYRSVYQFFEPTDDVTDQANLVIAAVGKLGAGDLPAMIDVEKAAASVTPAKYATEVQQWLDLVEAGTGKKPMIYTGKYFWEDNVGSDQFKDYVLVHAGYPNACQPPNPPPPMCTSCPNLADQFDDWQFWQYSSSGVVPGIPDAVDMDVFNGTDADLAALAAPNYAGEIVSIDVPMTMSPGDQVTGQITIKNVGGLAWDANTKLGTTGPRDRTSMFYDASTWPAANRASAVTATSVAPGDSYTFTIVLDAPTALGSYTESFGLVEDGVTWFSDDGGPADDAITLQLQVVEPNADTSSSASSGAGGGGGAPLDSADLPKGCSCSVGEDQPDFSFGFLTLGAVVALAAARMKRARA